MTDIDSVHMPSPPALEVRDLVAGYGSTIVLRDVSLVVRAGSVTALLGPNGAGKTSLLRAVSGLLPIRSGTVSIVGTDVTNTDAHIRARRGMCLVPEGRGIFRGLTVRENLALQVDKGQERDAIERAVEAFPILGERLNQRAALLSGGQQQMLAMSAAYLGNPRLVLVDEASLGLAPIVLDEIFDFLRKITDNGAALLIVDQFMNRALSIASTAYVMTRGKMVYDGPAKDLLDSDVFARYVGAVNVK